MHRPPANATTPTTTPEPWERSIYIAVGPNAWGKGFTPGQALDACIENNRDARRHYIMFECRDPWAYVDGMGAICYHPDQDDQHPTTSEKYYREIWRVDSRPKTRK